MTMLRNTAVLLGSNSVAVVALCEERVTARSAQAADGEEGRPERRLTPRAAIVQARCMCVHRDLVVALLWLAVFGNARAALQLVAVLAAGGPDGSSEQGDSCEML